MRVSLPSRAASARKAALAAALLLVSAAAAASSANRTERLHVGSDEVEILWDSWGVPHIYGTHLETLTYAQGWAQAHAHGNLLLRLFGIARGRAAEYWGGDEFTLQDLSTWTDELPQRTATFWKHMPAESKALCNAFGVGFTAYVNQHKDEFDEALLKALPITGLDTLGHSIRVIGLFMYARAKMSAPSKKAGSPASGESFNDAFHAFRRSESAKTEHISSELDWNALYSLNLLPTGPNSPLGLLSERNSDDGARSPLMSWSEMQADLLGSNSWAINSAKADEHGAKVLINPHLPFFDLFLWFESHLVLLPSDSQPTERLMYGAALVGMPSPVVGFNDFVGWSHTVNQIQTWTTYKLDRVNKGSASASGAEDADEYMYDGEVKKLASTTHVFRERLEDGNFKEHRVVVQKSVHGLVFQKDDDAFYAERLALKEDADMIGQYQDVFLAQNMSSFVDAWGRLEVGFFTVMAASKQNEIYALFNGWVPKRKSGTWQSWRTPVNGSTSETMWDELHEFDELPFRRNPASGYVQNANEAPWSFTLPYDNPQDYPAYMSGPNFLGPRPKASVRLMEENNAMTLDEFDTLKHSTHMEFATPLVDDLVDAVESLGPSAPVELRDAARVLKAWDRCFDTDSKGGVLFKHFRSVATLHLGNDFRLFKEGWDPREPLDTPRGLADVKVALEILAVAAVTTPGPIDEAFGERFRMLGRVDGEWATLPGNGGADGFRNTRFIPGLPDGKLFAVGGDTTVIVVEWTADGPRARSQLGYGNASQGKHNHDQMGLYSEKKTRPVWLKRAEVEANTERRETLRYRPSTMP